MTPIQGFLCFVLGAFADALIVSASARKGVDWATASLHPGAYMFLMVVCLALLVTVSVL